MTWWMGLRHPEARALGWFYAAQVVSGREARGSWASGLLIVATACAARLLIYAHSPETSVVSMGSSTRDGPERPAGHSFTSTLIGGPYKPNWFLVISAAGSTSSAGDLQEGSRSFRPDLLAVDPDSRPVAGSGSTGLRCLRSKWTASARSATPSLRTMAERCVRTVTFATNMCCASVRAATISIKTLCDLGAINVSGSSSSRTEP